MRKPKFCSSQYHILKDWKHILCPVGHDTAGISINYIKWKQIKRFGVFFFLSFLLSPPSSSFFPSSSSTSSARKTPGFLICACESWQQEDTCDLNSGWGLVLILPLPGRATLGWSLVLLSLGFITCKMGKIMPVMLGGWQEQGSKWLQTLINCQRTLTPLMQNCRRWGEGSTEQTVRSGVPGSSTSLTVWPQAWGLTFMHLDEFVFKTLMTTVSLTQGYSND